MNSDASGLDPTQVYERRLTADAEYRNQLWELLCKEWFQKFIPQESSVLEVAAGHCEFINHIVARRRIALDLNPEVARYAQQGVATIISSADQMDDIADSSVDTVFMSNFLEHIPKPVIVATLRECNRVLRPGGKIIVLQPNIRHTGADYWMFFDHVTPLDEHSLVEVLELVGFGIHTIIPRFLPYTTKSRLPKALWLVRLYLKVPLLWRVLGGQALAVATKK